MQNIVFNIEWN